MAWIAFGLARHKRKQDMRNRSSGLTAACCGGAALAIGLLADAAPARAQFGIPSGIIGGLMNGGIQFRFQGGNNRARTPRRGSNDGDNSGASTENTARDNQVLASIGGPPTKTQTSVLMSVVTSDYLGTVGSVQDLRKLGEASSKEGDRDWTGKIEAIVTQFKTAQAQDDKKNRGLATAGDVTAHAIEQSLESAFKNAKLDTFERFIGENWSAERLRKRILDRVEADLPSLLSLGNNRGNVSMRDIDDLIQRAAQGMYKRIFEISELLAANRSAALFVQRLYQIHGGKVDDDLRERADAMIAKAAATEVAKYDGVLRKDENGVALRYRAERIVYDCLSENVAGISSTQADLAQSAQIGKNIDQTAATKCATWLSNQFGERTLTAQIPMPMRVIWSADGPKDDASMYSQVRGAF
jgi:hypothetical protein